MPQYMTGNMFDVFNLVDHFLITTNSTIKNNGELVMGRGIAKLVKDLWPDFPLHAGTQICASLNVPNVPGVKGQYGVILGPRIGLFQVKYHFQASADLNLIRASTQSLLGYATDNPSKAIALNFPGIGNGQRSIEEVKPIIDILPDNVQIWSF